jgi:hypothetical protein
MRLIIGIMKTNRFFLGIFLIATLIFFASCAQTVKFQNSSVVPAAQGTVKVKQDDNNNYRIEVNIKDLADIKRLDSSKETYVVWMESRQGSTQNIGQLKSSSSFFSGQKKASLETVSSYEPFRIFVTAEHGENVRYPGNEVVLSTETFNP